MSWEGEVEAYGEDVVAEQDVVGGSAGGVGGWGYVRSHGAPWVKFGVGLPGERR